MRGLVILVVLTARAALADGADGIDPLDTARIHVSLGPSLLVSGSFPTAVWGLELTFGKPLYYGTGLWFRLVVDLLVAANFALAGSTTFVTIGPVLGFEVLFSRWVTADVGVGLGLGSRLAATNSRLGGSVFAQVGIYLQPFEDPRRRFKLEVRDITTIVFSVFSLSAGVGFETAF